MDSFKETYGRVCRKLELQRPAVLSNDNDLCTTYQIWEDWLVRSGLTWHDELARVGGPIFIKDILEVDGLACLSILRPK